MEYRSAENKIREIMAKSFLGESSITAAHMNPANKTSDEERVKAALKVLHDNGCPSAAAKDGKIEVNAMDANRAADVLDHAIAKSVLEVRPELVSAEAIPMPEPLTPAPVATPAPVGEEVEQVEEGKTVFHVQNGKTTVHLGDNHERVWTHNGHDLYRNKEDDKDHMLLRRDHSVHSMFHGDTNDVKDMIKGAGLPALRTGLKEEAYQLHELSTETLKKVANVARKKGRTDVLNAAIKAGKRNRSKPEYKFAGEEKNETVDASTQQLDEISTAAIMTYQKAATSKKMTPMDKRIDRRRKGLSLAAKKITKKIFGEESTPVNMILRVLSEGSTVSDKPRLRLKATVLSDCGKHSAKIYKDQDWGEHTVKYHINGKHHEPADSHHGDYEDAHDTARAEMSRLTKLNGALKEATEEEVNELMEDFEQLDELSKELLGRYVKGASASASDHATKHAVHSSRAKTSALTGVAKSPADSNLSLQHRTKKESRLKNISKATDKLTSSAKG